MMMGVGLIRLVRGEGVGGAVGTVHLFFKS